jgi:uncharacterized membrane protein YphA (DoxX/SURF4 family)
MATLSSTAATIRQPAAASRGRAGLIGLWAIQVALAGMFFMSGGMKLAGAPLMVALFDAIGVGQWFRYVTGAIEVASAVALLVPASAVFGAALLIPTMLGAIATHLFIVGGSPAVPFFLLIGSAVVAWTRRDQLTSAVSNLR